MFSYDLLIVGAGLYGAVFAHLAKQAGYRCLVLEKRSHLAGNCYTEEVEGIIVHRYGAHIFHTSDEEIWKFANSFAKFRPFVNSPLAVFENQIYSLPFNMYTFYALWGIKTPKEALQKLEEERVAYTQPKNLEEQALSLVGKTIYDKLIKGYTQKQWGVHPRNLPPEIIKRLPLRLTFDNNYFFDTYQGIPEEGYTKWISRMLDGVDLKLGVDFLEDSEKWLTVAPFVVYTGMIDAFFSYSLGELMYRSLHFDTHKLPISNFQGNAVINYTDVTPSYTRIIEHKHFLSRDAEVDLLPHTILTYEYSQQWDRSKEAYYPLGDEVNINLYEKYRRLAEEKYPQVLFGGRLGRYKYLNMDQVIAMAKNDFSKWQNTRKEKVF